MLSLFRTKKSLLKKKKYIEAERLLRHVKEKTPYRMQLPLLDKEGIHSEAGKSGELDYEIVKKKALDFIFDKNWKIRNIGVKLLGETHCKDGVQFLCDLLLDKREVGFIRRNSAKALGMIGLNTPQIIDALSRSIDSSYWEIRTEAIKALGILAGKNKEVEERLLRRLLGDNFQNGFLKNEKHKVRFKEKNFEVREAIAECLGRVGVSKNAVLALKYLLKDEIWMVRSKALNSLSMILDHNNEEFKKIISKIDLTCESFVPVFPLKETFSDIISNKKVKK